MCRCSLELPNTRTLKPIDTLKAKFVVQVRSSSGVPSEDHGSSNSDMATLLEQPAPFRDSSMGSSPRNMNTQGSKRQKSTKYYRPCLIRSRSLRLPTASTISAAGVHNDLSHYNELSQRPRLALRRIRNERSIFSVLRLLVQDCRDACRDTAALWFRNARALFRGARSKGSYSAVLLPKVISYLSGVEKFVLLLFCTDQVATPVVR